VPLRLRAKQRAAKGSNAHFTRTILRNRIITLLKEHSENQNAFDDGGVTRAVASVVRMGEATAGSLPLRTFIPHIAAFMRATARNRASDDQEIRRAVE
jgi:hypothetical protein